MDPLSKIENRFYKVYKTLDEEELINLNSHRTPSLNNVITGRHKQCFGIALIEDTPKIKYRLIYANGCGMLQGDVIDLTVDDPDRDSLLFYFSQFIEHNYKSVDTIDAFNTFQENLRTMLEAFKYLTVSSTEFKDYGDPNPLIIANNIKDIVNVSYIDKISFYQSFFNYAPSVSDPEINFIYLMFNKRNNHFKIGKSKHPIYRERTLQSQEPEVELIAKWRAPENIEKKLHQHLSVKRIRGEWFKLSFKDLQFLNTFMGSLGSNSE